MQSKFAHIQHPLSGGISQNYPATAFDSQNLTSAFIEDYSLLNEYLFAAFHSTCSLKKYGIILNSPQELVKLKFEKRKETGSKLQKTLASLVNFKI